MDIDAARKIVADAEIGPMALTKAWLDDHDKEWTAALIQDLALLKGLSAYQGVPLEQIGLAYTVGYWRGHNDSWK